MNNMYKNKNNKKWMIKIKLTKKKLRDGNGGSTQLPVKQIKLKKMNQRNK